MIIRRIRAFYNPMLILEAVCVDISMDFVNALPKSMGNEALLVVIDRLNKYGHFVPLKHPHTAADVARALLDNVYKLHGMPQSIVSDRGNTFISSFW